MAAVYKKSNQLINAKYKLGLNENKILAIALAKSSNSVTKEKDGNTYQISEITSSEIKKWVDIESSNFSRNIKAVTRYMASQFIELDDEDGKHCAPLIAFSDYKNGVLTLYWNHFLKDFYETISKNYTMLSLRIMTSMESSYSFRLYEYLRSCCYANSTSMNVTAAGNYYQAIIDVDELRSIMGAVSLAVNKSESNISANGTIESWSMFKKRALDVAVKEINEKADMNVTYIKIRSGLGGKTSKVEFNVSYKSLEDKISPELMADEDKIKILDLAAEILIKEGILYRDIQILCEAAKYDIKTIEDKVAIMNTKSNIQSKTGWLLSAIKNDFSVEKTEPQKTKKIVKNEKVHNFLERDYNYDQLAMDLILN